MKVVTTTEVKEYLNDLITILYEKKYFGYEDTAKKYVNDLLDDIITTLPRRMKKPAPKSFTSIFGDGLYYSVFPKNKRTSWYAFFRVYRKNGELIYQVRYIGNNHTVAKYL